MTDAKKSEKRGRKKASDSVAILRKFVQKMNCREIRNIHAIKRAKLIVLCKERNYTGEQKCEPMRKFLKTFNNYEGEKCKNVRSMTRAELIPIVTKMGFYDKHIPAKLKPIEKVVDKNIPAIPKPIEKVVDKNIPAISKPIEKVVDKHIPAISEPIEKVQARSIMNGDIYIDLSSSMFQFEEPESKIEEIVDPIFDDNKDKEIYETYVDINDEDERDKLKNIIVKVIVDLKLNRLKPNGNFGWENIPARYLPRNISATGAFFDCNSSQGCLFIKSTSDDKNVYDYDFNIWNGSVDWIDY